MMAGVRSLRGCVGTARGFAARRLVARFPLAVLRAAERVLRFALRPVFRAARAALRAVLRTPAFLRETFLRATFLRLVRRFTFVERRRGDFLDFFLDAM
jgi:hypothetical protein